MEPILIENIADILLLEQEHFDEFIEDLKVLKSGFEAAKKLGVVLKPEKHTFFKPDGKGDVSIILEEKESNGDV